MDIVRCRRTMGADECVMLTSRVTEARSKSIRSIAAQLGVAHTTVMRWQRIAAPVHSHQQLREWRKRRALSKSKITQTRLASDIGRSVSQLTAWKKWGAPLDDIHALRQWAERRGLLKRIPTQRSVAACVLPFGYRCRIRNFSQTGSHCPISFESRSRL